MMATKNILVTGLVRSGTSWIGKMISLADSLCLTFEPFHVNHKKIYGNYKIPCHFPYLTENNEEFNKYARNVFSHKYSYAAELLNSYSRKNFKRTLFHTIPKYFKKSLTCKNSLIKDPFSFFLSEYLFQYVQDLNVILTIRRPEGFVYSFLRHEIWDRHFICNSLLKQPDLIRDYSLESYAESLKIFADHELRLKENRQTKMLDEQVRLERACLIWCVFANVYSQFKAKYEGEWIFIKYEEIAVNPLNEFEKIYSKLGLNYSEKVQKQIQEYTTNNKTDSKFVIDLKRNSEELAFYWESKLSENEKAEIYKLTNLEYNLIYEQ